MRYEAVIGLELHIQLDTNSKLFSSSPNTFGSEPNDNTNELDLAYPGVLPVLNRQAVVYAAMFGQAIDAKVNPHAFFMRKNYFYPDLPKGYQISQLDDAVIQGGTVVLDMGEYQREVRINRGQLEEDAGKSVHDAFSDRTGIDLNRAGVPLIELVSEPDMRSAKEAVAFMRKIHHLVRYLGISDGNMQEGSFRCDANVSIREPGSEAYNARVELKNINSFRFVEQAINIEIERQSDLMDQSQPIDQETRLFDAEKQETRTMRSKEEANDYRYFPDPDLLPLDLDEAFFEEVAEQLPELPHLRRERYRQAHELDEDSLDYILQDRYSADFFDAVVAQCGDGKLVSNWLQGEFARLLNEHQLDIDEAPVSAEALAALLQRIQDGTISGNAAKKLLPQMWESGESADVLIDAQGLKQVNDDQQILSWIDEVIVESPDQVAAYQNGQEKMLGYFVGQVLKRSKGQANPKTVNQLLRDKLKQ
ncbi:Asp-tRNA(Asn)/Glu-tRNA(Gln) amidotransferase subunit GatB [Suttonella sp. R2A3]|uniref:Asp-tRNA(Asn)/Glu-tRNA(Gln) amidotransferase subunit GatB n=1 Tax=Suttonella sp. R2A3 TaxID=2908648 RepID=UPI001F2482C5|nr:Asp-tRNA(Asn)/Glu-tRNA(Gln) amidotransferase subunit GatB [Suttonella sp. R2A3]UJF25104.1 Asp-tRNA(Asn)/Glu-tRNA(Gln) amidotransferase subunit GatB [Suttonella sp. R2A3]